MRRLFVILSIVVLSGCLMASAPRAAYVIPEDMFTTGDRGVWSMSVRPDAYAQAPAAAKPAAAPSPFDETEQALIGQTRVASIRANEQCQIIRTWLAKDDVSQSVASTACQALQASKDLTAIQQNATAAIEAKHKVTNQTIDWAKLELVTKAAKK